VTEEERLEAIYRERVLPAYRALLVQVRADVGTRPGGTPAFERIGSRGHGLGHWARVGCLALRIADDLPAAAFPTADRDLPVTLAAFFHDSGRTIDGYEPGHAEGGARVFEAVARRGSLPPEITVAVAQAIRLHEIPESVVPGAGGVTIALSNADRLDRVRLGDRPIPSRMYDDGVWPSLVAPSAWLLRQVTNRRAWADVADVLEWPRDP
jgi:hypothetical protein